MNKYLNFSPEPRLTSPFGLFARFILWVLLWTIPISKYSSDEFCSIWLPAKKFMDISVGNVDCYIKSAAVKCNTRPDKFLLIYVSVWIIVAHWNCKPLYGETEISIKLDCSKAGIIRRSPWFPADKSEPFSWRILLSSTHHSCLI
jgi:hypothetical protein